MRTFKILWGDLLSLIVGWVVGDNLCFSSYLHLFYKSLKNKWHEYRKSNDMTPPKVLVVFPSHGAQEVECDIPPYTHSLSIIDYLLVLFSGKTDTCRTWSKLKRGRSDHRTGRIIY